MTQRSVATHPELCLKTHARYYNGNHGEQLNRELFSPPERRKKGVEQRDTEIQEMPEREAATAGPRQLTRHHIRPNIMYIHSPVIALLLREKVVIYEILK